MEKRKTVKKETSVEDLAAQVEALTEIVAAGSATIQVAEPQRKTADDLPVFSLEGIAYRFRVHGFSLDGSDAYNSAEVCEDEALCAMIVKDYPGLIELV